MNLIGVILVSLLVSTVAMAGTLKGNSVPVCYSVQHLGELQRATLSGNDRWAMSLLKEDKCFIPKSDTPAVVLVNGGDALKLKLLPTNGRPSSVVWAFPFSYKP
jgi:hypothetical protein